MVLTEQIGMQVRSVERRDLWACWRIGWRAPCVGTWWSTMGACVVGSRIGLVGLERGR